MRFAIYSTLVKTRSIVVNSDMTVTINDAPGLNVPGQVYPARAGGGKDSDGSPRSVNPRHLVWFRVGDTSLRGGDRFTVGGTEYEVLTDTIGRRAGVRVLVNEVEAAPVASVYPLLAQLSDLGGVVVLPEFRLAIWEGSRSDASHGEYGDLQGEAPAEHFNALKIPNREIVVGSAAFRITQAILHTDVPHVKLRLRTADG